MRILILGGTGFIGRHLVEQLVEGGHDVMVFHRGQTGQVPAGVWEIIGDRHDLDACRERLRATWPDVVVDLIASSGRQVAAVLRVFRGVAGRLVVISSMDVYRSSAVLHCLDTGSLEPVPLTEDSGIRNGIPAYPAAQVHAMMQVFGWLDEQYDKVVVERVATADPELPATVLRLPMIYGPGDPLHRLFPLIKRIDDGRTAIPLAESVACWRGSRGFVGNVAAAIALVAVSDVAGRTVYNVCDAQSFTELEWAQAVAHAAGWQGRFVILPDRAAPEHLKIPGNLAQHWTASSARLRRELGYWEPFDLGEALRQTVAWEREHHAPGLSPQPFDYEAEDLAIAASVPHP